MTLPYQGGEVGADTLLILICILLLHLNPLLNKEGSASAGGGRFIW
jgi:hypothetical protein